MLRAARGLNNAAGIAHLPALLGAHAFIDDPERRRNIMRMMSATQVATGMPLVYEASRAGARAVRGSSDRGRAAGELASPTWPPHHTPGGEYLRQAWPILSGLAAEFYYGRT
jgi:hypothetical protein